MRHLLDWDNASPLHRLPLGRNFRESHLLDLEGVIEYAAQMLPAEGPITGFSFLNPLHAFEHLPFEEAVRIAIPLFGGQPYLPEERYHEAIDCERIRPIDLQATLEADLGKRGWEPICGLCSRLSLRLAMLQFPLASGTTEELQWCIAETQALSRFRSEAPPQARNRITTDLFRWVVRDLINAGSENGGYRRPGPDDPRWHHVLRPLLERFDDSQIDHWSTATWEAFTMQALWRVCHEGVGGVEPATDLPRLKVRPRDVLMEATGVDSDVLVHDMLIRFCAAFADQGFAHCALPNREQGFYQAFLKLYGTPGGPPDRWLQGLAVELARLDDAGIGPMQSIYRSLEALGIGRGEWEDFFPYTVLALRGWASMIRQMDVRGDRFPVPAPHGTLTDYLAVRLILERFALAHVAREEMGYHGPLEQLRAAAQQRAGTQPSGHLEQRTFIVFQLAQLLGWCPSTLHQMSRSQWTTLLAEIDAFANLERRRVFHQAFEHRYETAALDAIAVAAHRKTERVRAPQFQASFCIDAREESFRRYIQELCPNAETFATAGFYAVPIYYRGIDEASYNPLCPVIMKPSHWMAEESVYALQDTDRRRARTRRIVGAAKHGFSTGSRTFALGALLSGGLGVLASIPLLARVLFPRWTGSLSKTADRLMGPPDVTRLVVERNTELPGSADDAVGFSLAEMANTAERVLRDIGLTSGFARLFFLVGHRSECLNNPHKSTYDCGACTGPGGPNARALALMLNDRRVRTILAERNLLIPEDTIFIGAHHNTALETMVYYDLALLPRSHRKDFEAARDVLAKACELNAHERCRRFDSAPLHITPAAAHRHVQARAEDLSQVRPEFGNATNTMCYVGRHHRTRGLFMDRRAFQQSYDAAQDDAESTILARILSAVIPVCQGINLQYYFSSVDSARWGAGTKLPHNVASLLGVMDGAASDLRQGLPWQSVEIHEPMRCLFVIEATPDAMLQIMSRNKAIDRVIRNGWAKLAVLSPDSNELRLFTNGEFQLYHPETTTLPRVSNSTDWFRGSRVHLDFSLIEA